MITIKNQLTGETKTISKNDNLINCDLRDYDLEKINLSNFNLEGANLADVNLKGANLEGANLKHADLNCANLEGANLKGTNLEGTALEGANLRYADLSYANLKETSFYNTWLIGTNFEGTKKRGALGLRTAFYEEIQYPSKNDRIILFFKNQIITEVEYLLKCNCYRDITRTTIKEDRSGGNPNRVYVSNFDPKRKIKFCLGKIDEYEGKGLIKPYIVSDSNEVLHPSDAFVVKIIQNRIDYLLRFQSEFYINTGSPESPSYVSVLDI